MACFSYRFAARASVASVASGLAWDARRAILAGSVLVGCGVLTGCAGEDPQAKYPQVIGSDSFHQMLADDAQEQAEAVVGPGQGAPDGQGDPNADSYSDTDPSALTDFHGALDSHGQWIDDSTYGTMWQPSEGEVGSDFAPYVSGGHWAYDDSNEYVWMSDYNPSWSWAPFHYGRWAYGSTGWGWIPGRAYAPAWVSWRVGYPGFGYVGWAPMAPSYYWGPGGVAYGLAVTPPTPYAFCGVHDLFAQNGLQSHIVANPGGAIAGQTHNYTSSSPQSPASPQGGGRVPAHPTVAGPSPKSLNLSPSEVAHVATSNPQLAHAMQFSRPSTAVAMGAHAPLGSNIANRANVAGRPGTQPGMPGGAVAGHAQLSRPSMPAYGASGGRTVYSNYSNTSPGSAEHVGESYYGHGGTYRSYGGPSAPHMAARGSGAVHSGPVTTSPEYVAPHTTTTSQGHFGGHYGGGAHGGGGGHR
jgi:hypothetical protein